MNTATRSRSRTAPTSVSLFAEARRYQAGSRSLAVRHSVMAFVAGFDGGAAERLAEVRARQLSLHLAACAYRDAGRRRARLESLGRLVRMVVGR
jgi:hypothetical protein